MRDGGSNLYAASRADEGLPERLAEVALLIARGRQDKQIAKELKLSLFTVKGYVKDILQRWRLKNRAEIAARASTTSPDPDAANLVGLWISRFDFKNFAYYDEETSKPVFRTGVQIYLELVRPARKQEFPFSALNYAPTRNEGEPYRHKLDFKVEGPHALGFWKDRLTAHTGSFQLLIHNDRCTLRGAHLGNTSNGDIKAGKWVWRRLVHSASDLHDLERTQLKDFQIVEELFRRSLSSGSELRLVDFLK